MKAFKNYLYNLTFQMLLIILPIVTTPYISRVLQVDGVGRYSVAYALCNYFVLFGMLGFSSYGSREIAYVRDNEFEKIQTFWEINNVKFVTMAFSLIVYILYIEFFVSSDLKLLYITQIFTLLAYLVDISWFFAGMENFKKTATRNIIVKLVSVGLIFTFVKTRGDLAIYAIIISASTFAGQLVLWKDIQLWGLFRWRKSRRGKCLYHLKRTIGLWLPALAINIFTYLDKIMLGYISGDIEVGLYESSDKIVRMAITAVTAFATVMVPKMANLFANKDLNDFKKIINKSLYFVMMLSIPMTFGIIGISRTIVPWFFGEGYEGTSGLMLFSAWLAIALGFSSVFGNQVLISINKEKEYTIAVFIAAFTDIILNFILIPKFDAYGAVISTVIAEFISMIMMMIYAKNYFTWSLFVKKLIIYFVMSFIMCVIITIIGEWLGAKNYTTILQVMIGIITYLGMLVLIKDDNIHLALAAIKRKKDEE